MAAGDRSKRRELCTRGHCAVRDDIRRFAVARLLEIESQRSRLAEALHDDVGQALMALNLHLYRLSTTCNDDSLVATLIELRTMLLDTSRAVRRLAAEYRPLAAYSQEVQAVATQFIERFEFESGTACALEIESDPDPRPLSAGHAIALHGVLRLALDIVVRCGFGARPAIRIARRGAMLAIAIRDESLDVSEQRPPLATHSVTELRDWIAALNGDLRFDSHGRGDILRIGFPLED